ncbi:hypothetical protein [Bartonella sp. A05]|uniref:hypothetical protein n=1 Tax=Bartonella sp. A05 TaxID=2967261 RepID=UPI0022A97E5E|nr:hypothetical protein [Bartonella sp. A05]MCZ2203908.1 hypothetical protein [Bartonella sp. A05]
MVNLHDRVQKNNRYWLTYIVGFIAISIIIIVGGFYMVKPYLDSFVQQEIARRSINAETSEVSIIGRVNLTNVTVPVPADMSLKIKSVSGRPPIAFIPGVFTLYDVDLKYKNIHVQIPKISINNVSLKGKDKTITSRFLQSLMRIDIASIIAPDVQISIGHKNTETFNIKNFQLSNFKNGLIRSVGIKNIITKTNLATTNTDDPKLVRLIAQSDAMQAHDINISYAYSILFGENKQTNQSKTVTGSIVLENMIIDLFTEKEKKSSFSFGKFQTSGLKMAPLEQASKKLVQDYLNAIKTNDHVAKKSAQNALLIASLSAITSVNAQIDKAAIDIPQIKATLETFQLKPSQWQQHIPQKLVLSLKGLSIFPTKIEKQDIDFFKNMDFERLYLSGELDASYNEKKQTLLLNAISFNIENIGSGKISAKIINVDKALFSGQKDAMIVASQDLGVTEIDMHYTDAGFIDKLFSYLAQSFNDDTHDLKQELYDDLYLIMTRSIELLLKDHKEAKNISKYFGDFAKNPKTLIIKIKAKDNKGLTKNDLETALQNDLSTVLNKVNITVTNETSN